MAELINVPASVEDMKPLKDRSWMLKFNTRELGGDEVALLAESFQGEGWLVFKPNAEVKMADIPEGIAEMGAKSPSQRLRSFIFIWWKQRGGKGDFESFYRTAMERLIDGIKERLDKEDH